MPSPGRELVGVDLSREMARLAKGRLGRGAEVIVADAAHLPFRDEVFNYVYSIRTLIFVPRGEKGRAIREMVRVLKPGCPLTLIECCVEGVENLNRLRRKLKIHNRIPAHRHLFFNVPDLEGEVRRSHIKISGRIYFPIISILEKVFYPRVSHVRGATRLLSTLCSIIYYADRHLCGLFPVLGHDLVYVGVKLPC